MRKIKMREKERGIEDFFIDSVDDGFMYVFFVSVCVDAFLHFSKTCCVNINELIWKRDIFASEIGKEAKCGYGSM
jgi:hypothetical protein